MQPLIQSTIADRQYHGISTSNLYVDINGQGKSTLSDPTGVDARLIKSHAVKLLQFHERLTRQINEASSNDIFSAGAIHASLVTLEILRTPVAEYAQTAFFNAICLNNPGITVYRSDDINNKLTVTEMIEYVDCYITGFETNVNTLKGENLSSVILTFRYNKRTDTLFAFDETGKPQGQTVSQIKFSTGTLQPSGGGGGTGGGAGGGGGALPA